VQRAKGLFDAAAATFALRLGSDHESTRDAMDGAERAALGDTNPATDDDTFIPGQLRY